MLVRLRSETASVLWECMKIAHAANVDQGRHQGSAAFKPVKKEKWS